MGALLAGTVAGCSGLSTNRGETRTTHSSTTTQLTTTSCEPLRIEQTPDTENGVWFALVFGRTVTDQGRELTIEVDEMTIDGGTGHELETYDIGTPADEPKLIHGAYPPESGNGRTTRWFGKQIIVQFPAHPGGYNRYSEVEMTARPAATEPPLVATLYAEDAATYRFTNSDWATYNITLHGGLECEP